MIVDDQDQRAAADQPHFHRVESLDIFWKPPAVDVQEDGPSKATCHENESGRPQKGLARAGMYVDEIDPP